MVKKIRSNGIIKDYSILIPGKTQLMYVDKFEIPFNKIEDLNCKLCGNILPVKKKRKANYYSICSCKCQLKCGNKSYLQSVVGKDTELFNKIWEECRKNYATGPMLERLKKKYGEEEGIKRYNHFLNGCNVSLSGFINRLGEEEGLKRYEDFKKKSLVTKEAMIIRHGEEEGLKRYNDMCAKMRDHGGFTFNYWIKLFEGDYNLASEAYKRFQSRDIVHFISKYGEEEGNKRFDALCDVRGKQNTIDYKIEKYGEEEGKKRWVNECKNKSVTLSRYINKYGEEDGKKRWEELNKLKSLSLDNLILHYGKEKGLSKYIQFKKNIILHLQKRHNRSKFQLEFINDLFELGEMDRLKYLYDENELVLFDDKTGSINFYDFCDLEKKKIVEIYGDYWHANPVLYNKDYYHKILKLTAEQIWEKNKKCVEKAKSFGYEVLILWEKDIRYNRIPEIKKALNFLRG